MNDNRNTNIKQEIMGTKTNKHKQKEGIAARNSDEKRDNIKYN